MRPYPVAVGARLCYIYGMEKANSSAPSAAAKTYLVVFDLDGTLAMLGAPVGDADAAALRTLSERAYIAIASGKPTYYLCGFARQLGIADAVLIGENGCTMQFGVALPPARNERFTSSKRALEQLDRARKDIPGLFAGGIWCQPNEVMFTPFPTSEEQFAVIRGHKQKDGGDRACGKARAAAVAGDRGGRRRQRLSHVRVRGSVRRGGSGISGARRPQFQGACGGALFHTRADRRRGLRKERIYAFHSLVFFAECM